MDISFYTAAVGAGQQQDRLDVLANNIANINTFGFRAKRPAFSQLMTGAVRGIDEDLQRGVGSRMITAETDFSTTALQATGRGLDYAIEGSGFFALLDPVSGNFTYTRDGSFIRSSFQVEAEADPVTGEVPQGEDGQPLMETKWYLSDGFGRFVMGEDGRPIEVFNDTDPLPVGIFDFINYNGMLSQSENGHMPIDKNGGVRLGNGKLIQGYVESSNTDLAYEFTKVIEAQRSFTYMLKMVQTSDEITTTVNNLR